MAKNPFDDGFNSVKPMKTQPGKSFQTNGQGLQAVQANSAGRPFQPRVADPISGQLMQRGRPVPTANAAPPPPGVTDPVSGQPMQRGRPVPTAYSGAANQQVGLGLRAAGGALAAGFRPPDLGAKAADNTARVGLQQQNRASSTAAAQAAQASRDLTAGRKKKRGR